MLLYKPYQGFTLRDYSQGLSGGGSPPSIGSRTQAPSISGICLPQNVITKKKENKTHKRDYQVTASLCYVDLWAHRSKAYPFILCFCFLFGFDHHSEHTATSS